MYPALQAATIHAALDVLEAGEVEPAGHFIHSVLPVPLLYVPAAHAVHELPLGHVVFVRSTLFDMASTIAVVASMPRYSSTTKQPATSAVNKSLAGERLMPREVKDNVLSVNAVATPLIMLPFTLTS